MPGMIHSPSSVAFTANGDVLVCESDRRLQLFNSRGLSVRVIGWGSSKPQAVSFIGSNQLIAIAEKTKQTIRFLRTDGSDPVGVQRWPDRVFGMPCSVAVCSKLGRLVVADCDRRTVTTHAIDGAVLSRCAAEYLGSPTHVATDENGTIFVSDALHCCIKVCFAVFGSSFGTKTLLL
jgi:DNA-binding beta-propeller fold protein YncE